MNTEIVEILSNEKIASTTYLLKFNSNYFSNNLVPGQFLNVKISNDMSFLLRRPFSVSQITGETVEIMYNVVGIGTEYLSKIKAGETIDVLGPLGNGFNISGSFMNAVVIGGGIGIAPLPYLIKKLKSAGKNVSIFFGYKNLSEKIDFNFNQIQYSTDDGSFGYKGNIINLFKNNSEKYKKNNTKIFACGPKAMLKSLSEFAIADGFEAEVSIESYMACGFGICQGCPVESKNQRDKYLLVCKDGPCFNIKDINL